LTTDDAVTVYVGNGALNYANGVTMCSDGSYCCGVSQTDCCVNGQGLAIIDYGQTATIPASSAALTTYYAGVHVSTRPISRKTTGSSSSAASPTSSTTNSQSSPTSISSGLTDSAKIGLGVGLGVGIPILLLLVFIAWLLIRRTGTYPQTAVEPKRDHSYAAPGTNNPTAAHLHDLSSQPEFVQYGGHGVRHELAT
jgi:hypothetical protein